MVCKYGIMAGNFRRELEWQANLPLEPFLWGILAAF